MNVDAVVGEIVNHKVEVKTEMSMKAIMKIIRMKMMMMTTRETVTRIPVVTKAGMKTTITAREVVDATGVLG
jgi:hypothetical protein